MGNEGPSEAQENVLEEVEAAVIVAQDTATGENIPILTNEGVLQTYTVTPDGDALTDALQSVALDELRQNVVEVGGQAQSAVDVADRIDQIFGALESQGIEELRSLLIGHDPNGNPQDVQADALSVGPSGTGASISTFIDRALSSVSGVEAAPDELRSLLLVTDDNDTPQPLFGTQLSNFPNGSEWSIQTAVTRALNSASGTTNSPDEVRVDLAEQALAQVSTDVEQVGGQAQSAVDLADRIQQLTDALQTAFAGDDQLRVDLQNNNAGTLATNLDQVGGTDQSGVDIANILSQVYNSAGPGQSLQTVLHAIGPNDNNQPLYSDILANGADGNGFTLQTMTALALQSVSGTEAAPDQLRVDLQNNNAGTLAVEQQTPVGIEDTGDTQLNPLAQRDLPIGTNERTGYAENLRSDTEFVDTLRVTGIADSSTAFQVAVSNPGGSGVDTFVAPTITTGGQAHLNVSENITIDTAGTALDELPKNAQSGSTTTATIEQGGTYTINGTTIQTLLPGAERFTGATSAAGEDSPGTGGVVIGPGESMLWEVVNQSGGSASFSITLSVVELAV